PFYLGDEIEIQQAHLSPAGDKLVLVVSDKKNDPGRQDQMPAWITESGYVTSQEVRPKVGTGKGPGQELIYLDLDAHEQYDLELGTLPGLTEDPLAELKRQTAAVKQDATTGAEGEAGDERSGGQARDENTEDEDTPAKPRPVIFEEPLSWSPDGTQLAVQAHSNDNKDRWIALVDFANQTLQPVHRLSHEAWINWYFNEFGWLADSRRLYFLSEESGYSQLYLYSLDDGSTRRLTDGDYVVSEVVLGPDEKYFYYSANPEHPGIYETYRVAIDSGRIEQLTDLGGQNSTQLSIDGSSLLITHSERLRPNDLFVQPARPGAEARRLTDHVSERFRALPWVEPEIVAVPSSHHDRPIYARYYPAQTERPDGTRPAVVFVHGAGYLQNAHQGWSVYFREFFFHSFLAYRGYAVLDMDYRASAGYGAAWRTAIYRQMGAPELEDLADGVDWLVSTHGVDRQRIGVYGGSYGGFLTMMALFERPDLFACGAALRPVTDWAHYNHAYTSNILNTPEVDPEAYRRSSPIELADGLEKPLLICAPMQDDNVFFQDTVRLAQRLIELEKEDWEVAIFPVEPHGFRQPSSWLNEYRRIFKLFETYIGS
ncbi:MAG: alpha/beta fold hydrolase, partial [Acidobacteriota bacterium]